jgi:CRP-like cAMP-binding protein
MNTLSKSDQQSSRQNHLLGALPVAAYRRLLPGLEFVTLPLGQTLDQRLCRDLLHAFDRTPANALAITHQRAADLLGVRRVGVTEAVGRLQAAGIIHCGRGQIKLLSRRRLKARACGCYAAIKKELDGLRLSDRAS